MRPGKRSRLGLGRQVAAALLAAALAPGVADAASGRPGDGDLSPRLAELARPSLRNAPAAEQAAALSLAGRGPGSLLREGRRVLVEVRFEGGATEVAGALREAGARVLHASRRYRTATAAVMPADLPRVAALPRVDGVSEVLAPIASATSCSGAATSEGDARLGAAGIRSALALDGSGVTVGILSDSFDRDPGAPTRAAGDIASGDLPGPAGPCGTAAVDVLDDSEAGGADEGRAMAQIVHDLAPGARLAFATGFTGLTAFADNVRRLHAAGARAIVDDVIYFEEPFFQEGPVGVAAREVTQGGSTYLTAVGNGNLVDAEGRDIASWEAPELRDSPGCPASLLTRFGADRCVDFDPGLGVDPTFGITVAAGATLSVDLQWAEPWFGVETDLDAFLLDSSGEPVEVEFEGSRFAVGSVANNVSDSEGGTGRPFELFQWRNDTASEQTVQLAVNRCFGPTCNPDASELARPRLTVVLLQNGRGVTATEYPESAGGDVVGPTVFGHSGAASAIGVGAVRHDATAAPERFSSRGPVTHYFGPVAGTAPAAALEPPRTIAKPDAVAPDGVANTFFGDLVGGVWRFHGTSAAAPHAAAVVALMREANPTLSPAAVRAALAATARPVGAFGENAVGAGLVDAYGAVAGVALPPRVSIVARPPALSRNRWPRIDFAASRPVSFACSLDAGPLAPCASPFFPSSRLGDGRHGFAVVGTDAVGHAGTSEVVYFTVDTRRPRTFFRRRPRKLVRTRHRRKKVFFRIGSSERDVVFVCRVDSGLARFCGQRLRRRFGAGRHALWVKARDAAGNVDRTPAVHRFRVKRVGKAARRHRRR